MNDNYLMKKENGNFFWKLKELFKKIFFRKKCTSDENRKIIKNANDEIFNNRIYQLQLAYENGEIKEENISEEDKNELILLYKKQIQKIEENISKEKSIFEDYKAKIMEEKNKLKKM